MVPPKSSLVCRFLSHCWEGDNPELLLLAARVTRGKGVPLVLPLIAKLPWAGGTFEPVAPGPDLQGVSY